MENGHLSGVLFLDLKKAFDTVNHSVIFSKLSHMNMSLKVVRWFKSYLSNRYQTTNVGGIDSDYLPVNCGVPQGSILGPLLFVLYVNNLPSVISKSEVFLYADDTAIVYGGKDPQEIMAVLNAELGTAASWLADHRLSLNATKTKLMFFWN